jgi:hypothetical protein
MLFKRDYQKPFWQGFFHAVGVVFYILFISIVLLSLNQLFLPDLNLVIQLAFLIFLTVLSTAVCAYFIFYSPLKLVVHRHFKAASVMIASTFGWLFIFLIIFLLGLVFSFV